jgi:fructosamine-3-kinase
LIDPACYHGHTEVDLGMLGLFDPCLSGCLT